MKIAIPASSNTKDSDMSMSFGRAPFFLIYDTDKEEYHFLINPAVNSPGSAGTEAAHIILDNGADVLLTPSCGKNAAEIINTAHIPIYKTIHKTTTENIDAFLTAELPQLNE